MYIPRSYLELNPDTIEDTSNHISDQLLKLKERLAFDSIVIRGMSGASIGFPVTMKTKIPLVVSRKHTENSHGAMLESDGVHVNRYIILDDFIDSGDTIRSIIESFNRRCNFIREGNISCVGIVLYQDSSDTGIAENSKTFTYDNMEIPIFNLTMK